MITHRRTPLSSFLPHPSPTDLSPLSLHDALPIFPLSRSRCGCRTSSASECPLCWWCGPYRTSDSSPPPRITPFCCGGELRSEEHTSELQSRGHLVCRLLLEKKKNTTNTSRKLALD